MQQIDHTNYPLSLTTKSDAELHFIAKDAFEAERANPDGPKAGYYLDEINYVSNELFRRRHGPRSIPRFAPTK